MPISRRNFLQFSAITVGARLLPLPSDSANSALCRKLASDPLRPQYHLLPAHNWMNDPNGPIFFRGRYHMFYQYNPEAAVWGDMHWAHATSPDMLHWQHQPIALAPTPNGPDRDGVFSGSAILDHGAPTVIYTGVAPPASASEATLRDGVHTWRETQCLAIAEDDGLRRWKKLPAPVIAAPPPGLEVTGFRDPCLWREGGKWMLILGSGTRQQGGMVLLYTSSNLRDWTYLHPLVAGSPSGSNPNNPVASGDMWECPDFFPLGNKHVLLISTMGKVHWKAGTYARQRFTPEKEGVVDWGAYYAAKTMLDAQGNRILWGWIRESRPDTELIAAGWAGAMSLPRVLSLGDQGELQTEVVHAGTLRTSHQSASMAIDESGTEPPAQSARKMFDNLRIHNLAAELDIVIRPKGDEFTLSLRSDDGADFAAISCVTKPGSRQLRLDNWTAQLAQEWRPEVGLHLFLDGSILEVFANGTALTARIYCIPTSPLRLHLEGSVDLISIDSYQMQPISTDRLTGSLCSQSF